MSAVHPYRDIISTLAIAAAWSDGSVCDNEKRALERIMSHLGYEAREIAVRLAGEMTCPVLESIEVPAKPEVRLDIMRYAMAVTLADGSLEPSEKNFLARLTDHLGISPQILTILRREAEQLVAVKAVDGPASIVPRVEALLPESK